MQRLPSMHHQFKELADVDITAEPMEVGPTCHYVMGGVEVDPDTAAAAGCPGLFAAGEVAGGMHGSNRLGGNSLSDLLVFGRRAGRGRRGLRRRAGRRSGPRSPTPTSSTRRRRRRSRPFEAEGGENPYTLHQELQQTMNDLVGIIRTRGRDRARRSPGSTSSRSALGTLSVEGHRQFNPGWHLALDLRNMLLVSECVARAALERQESRGGHTRDDYPAMDPQWRRSQPGLLARTRRRLRGHARAASRCRRSARDLLALFERDELAKYLTPEELAVLDARRRTAAGGSA